MKSRFIWAMKATSIPFGQAASHSWWFVQAPKPASSMAATILRTRS